MRCRGGSGTIALAVLLLGGLLAFAVAAQGSGEPEFGCKKVYSGTAAVNPNPKGLPPVVIGDSTVLLPIPPLTAVGFSVNAKGCRAFRQAIDVAAKLRAKHRLPHLVMLNDYGNRGLDMERVREALDAIGRSRVLGLVTEYDADTGRGPAAGTGVVFQARKAYPHRIFVLDWIKYSRAHHKAEPKPGAWFLPDLFHPNFTGAEAYAQFLATALPYSKNGRFP